MLGTVAAASYAMKCIERSRVRFGMIRDRCRPAAAGDGAECRFVSEDSGRPHTLVLEAHRCRDDGASAASLKRLVEDWRAEKGELRVFSSRRGLGAKRDS